MCQFDVIDFAFACMLHVENSWFKPCMCTTNALYIYFYWQEKDTIFLFWLKLVPPTRVVNHALSEQKR